MRLFRWLGVRSALSKAISVGVTRPAMTVRGCEAVETRIFLFKCGCKLKVVAKVGPLFVAGVLEVKTYGTE